MNCSGISKDYPPPFKLKDGQSVVICHTCNAVIDPSTTGGTCPWCDTELKATDLKVVKLL